MHGNTVPNGNPEFAAVLRWFAPRGLWLRGAATAGRDALWGLCHRRNPCKVCQFTIEPLQTGMVLSLWRKRISFDKKRII